MCGIVEASANETGEKMNEYVYPHIDPSDEAKVRGLELRDYFAAKAITGVFSDGLADGLYCKTIAERAYLLADAMLQARGKS
jgi:hypothetical protein